MDIPHPFDSAVNSSFLLINTSSSENCSKWTLSATVTKEECSENVEFQVTVDNPPTINVPRVINVYQNVNSKVNWGTKLIYDVDG